MISLHSLQLFVQVVKDGSFAEAGRSVGLSAASISRHVASLEDHLDLRLFNRSSRKLSLTEGGSEFYERVDGLLLQLRETVDSIANFEGAPKGRLRVHARVGLGNMIIAPAVPRFLKKYPEISLEFFVSNEAEVDLIGENIDIDIRLGVLRDSSLTARKIVSCERIAVASPAYFGKAGPIDHPSQLANHNCISYSRNLQKPIWKYIDRTGETVEVPIKGSLVTDSGEIILEATLAGVGISLWPDIHVKRYVKSGQLVRILSDFQLTRSEFENGVYAVFQTGRHRAAKVDVFIQFLLDVFREAGE